MKRIIAALLCLCLVFSLCPRLVRAEEPDEETALSVSAEELPEQERAEERLAEVQTQEEFPDGSETTAEPPLEEAESEEPETVTVYATLSHSGTGIDGNAALLPLTAEEGSTVETLFPQLTEQTGLSAQELAGRRIYLNGAAADSTAPLSAGAHVELCALNGTESYASFSALRVAASMGESVELTLVGGAGAAITVNGEKAADADAQGKFALSFSQPGRYVLSAYRIRRVGAQVIQLITAPVCVVTVAAPPAVLTSLEIEAGGESLFTEPFTVEEKSYTLCSVEDQVGSVSITAAGLGENDRLRLITADKTVRLGSSTGGSASFLRAGRNAFTLRTVSASGGAGTDYSFTVDVLPTLKSVSFSRGGNDISLDRAFDPAVCEYVLSVDERADSVTVKAEPFCEDVQLSCGGAEGEEVSLTGLDALSLELRSADGLCTKTYTFTLQRVSAADYRITVVPANAVVKLYDKNGNEVLPEENGSYSGILAPEDYTYTATLTGYVAQSGRLSAESSSLSLTLEKIPEKEEQESVEAQWENFRNAGTNMAITDTALPTRSEDATLLWNVALGENGDWSAAPSVQIIVDNALIVMSGTKLYKLDLYTGEVLCSGDMCEAPNWGYTPPSYADGMIFCPLSGGVIQAFDAKTLRSLWIYRDSAGGQSLSPITCSGGYLYTGFWTGETKNANYVCLSVSDEDPTRDDEIKTPTWRRSHKGGFYWAGSVAVGDALIVSTEDGSDGIGDSQLWSLNRSTGAIISALTLKDAGDARSSVAYSAELGRVFVTTEGGLLCSAAVDEKGRLTDLKTLALGGQSTSTPVIYKGMAYFGIGSGVYEGGSSGSFVVVDAVNMEKKSSVDLKGYPQCSMLLSTAHESEGYLDFYSTYNSKPGGLSNIRVKLSDYSLTLTEIYDAAGFEEYCITSPICSSNSTIYYKNDSGNVLAVGFTGSGVVISLIDRLDKNITISSRTAVENARSAYEKLSEEDKKQVTNYAALVAAEAALAPILQRIDAAAAAIRAIGTIDGTAASESRFRTAQSLYSALSEAERDTVPEETVKLYTDAQWEQERYDNAREVEKLIAAIGTVTNTAASRQKIEAARKAFDALLSTEKKIVIDEKYYATLTAAERTLSNQQGGGATKSLGTGTDTVEVTLDGKKYKVDREAAELIRSIEKLAGSEKPAEADVLAAVKDYNAMSETLKAQVLNYEDLKGCCTVLGVENHKSADARTEELRWSVRMELTEKDPGSVSRNGYDSLRSFSLRLTDTLTGEEAVTEPFNLSFDAPVGCGDYPLLRMLFRDRNGRESFCDCTLENGRVSFVCQGAGEWTLLGERGESSLELPEEEAEEPAEHGVGFLIPALGLVGAAGLLVLLYFRKRESESR